MKPWQDAVQAQLFYTQKHVRSIETFTEDDGSIADYKMYANELLLTTKALWQAWLNEWAEYLSPKQKLTYVDSWYTFSQSYKDRDEVSRLLNSGTSDGVWLAAVLDVERLNPLTLSEIVNQWSSAIKVEHDEVDDLQVDFGDNALSLKPIDAQTLDISAKPDDLIEALAGLKSFISTVRAHHSEY